MSAASTQPQPWTPEELLPAVAAYLEMLALEQQQQPYSKTKYRQRSWPGHCTTARPRPSSYECKIPGL